MAGRAHRLRVRICLNIVRFMSSLDRFRDERKEGGTRAREIFLEEGRGKDGLHTVEEDPTKGESNYLTARFAVNQGGDEWSNE